MIPILYESNETAFVSNGLARLRDCVSCVVTEGRNEVYECDFEYPVSGANFDLIKCGRIIAVTHNDTGDLQPFDIVSYSKPIDGIVTFHAVHISYRLGGIVVVNNSVNSLAAAFTGLNALPKTYCPFTFSADFTSNNYIAAYDGVPRTIRQILGGIEGSILDSCGGEYEWDKWNVYLHRNRGTARDFTIRYGVNLVNYQEDTDYQGTFGSCVPYWVGSDDQGQQTVVRGSRVDSNLPTYSGRNIVVPLDLTDKFETKPTAAQLQSLAASYMTANQVNVPSQNINVDFVRLQDMSEYADFAPLLQCGLCDTIKVVFPAYGLDARFKIVKTVYNVLGDRFDSMELGSLATSLADALGISQGSSEKYNTITNLSMSGDLTVGGNASVSGDIVTNGGVRLNNAKTIYFKDTGGTYRAVVSMSTSNNTVIGYGGYDASQGGTNIYGNTVRFFSNNAITFNQPLAGLFKVTDVSKSVSGISAHSYQSGISFSMTAQSGYNAVGVIGWSSTNYRIYPFRVEVTSNTNITASLSNATAAAAADFTMHFYVLWLKATSA